MLLCQIKEPAKVFLTTKLINVKIYVDPVQTPHQNEH